MQCSVFENDESVVGRKACSSVMYFKVCFREKMEREMDGEDEFQRRTMGKEIKDDIL